MISRRISQVSVLIVALTLVGPSAPAQDSKLSKLLEKAPSQANSMAYLHAPSMKKLMADAQMTTQINEQLEELWLVSDLNTVTLRPNWEAGYAMVQQAVDGPELAKRLGGYVDTIDGRQVVWTPMQSYIVPVGDSQLGFLRPANRRLLSSWLTSRSVHNPAGFLAEHAVQPEKYLSFMLAVDLEGVFSPVTLSTRLAEFDLPNSVDATQVSKILASIRGLTIIIGRKSLDECIASFEFSESPESIQPFAVQLLGEILRRNGTDIQEVANWNATVKDNTLAFRGTIGADSFDSLLGIFSLEQQVDRALPTQAGVESEPTSASSSGPNAVASKKYFDDIQAHIERVRNYSAQTTGYRAKWNDQQARKIDELGTLHVDPDLINYGQDVANLLRGNALTIRTGNIEAGATKAAQSLISGGYYGTNVFGNVYYDPNTSIDYQRVTDARARAAASSDYRTTLKGIDEMSSAMRKVMTSRYNVQF